MVESDHGEATEEVKMVNSGVGDTDNKKMDIAGKRSRDDLSEDESNELPAKRQRSEVNDHDETVDQNLSDESMRKANGSANLKPDGMEIEKDELEGGKMKIASEKSDENNDETEKKDIAEKELNDTASNNEKSDSKRESVEDKDEEKENAEKNDASSEDKIDEDDDEEVASKEKKTPEKSSGKASVSKSKTKEPEVVDGLEMTVECASDKEASSSEEEKDEENKKPRPKTIIVKAKPNDSELDVSTSEEDKSDVEDEKVDKKAKKTPRKGRKPSPNGKGRKKGKKKGFTKVPSSESDDSDDNASEDEDYSPRTKKKMKKTSPSKKTPAKTPGKKRGRAPKNIAKKSDDEGSDEREDDDVNLEQRSKKGKEKNQKNVSGSDDDDKSEEDTANEATPKNGKKSKARPEDDKRIQALKKYFPMAGIRIQSYKQFWAGCTTNTARLARMKEELARHGIVGRPTMEKCKKAKARLELKQDAEQLDPVADITEGRVTRARGGKPKGETPSRQSRKRVSTVVDSESE